MKGINLGEFLEDLVGTSIVKVRSASAKGNFQLHCMLGGGFKIKSGGEFIFETDNAEEVVEEFNRLTLN